MNINGMSKRANTEILNSNLHKIREREAFTSELRALTIKDIDLPSTDIHDVKELVRIYRKYMPLDGMYTIADRALFCSNLYDSTSISLQNVEKICDTDVITDLAYVKNQYSEEAASILSKSFSVNKKRHYRSFSEMCEDIESGICDGCIVPLENTSDGKLMNFYSIIDRFDLKIACTCDIENQNGDQTTRYALLRNKLNTPQDAEKCYLEFSFISSENISLTDVIKAAEISGLKLHRIDSMPMRYNDSEFVYYPVFLGITYNVIKFTLFLKLNLSQYTMVGIYNRIK